MQFWCNKKARDVLEKMSSLVKPYHKLFILYVLCDVDAMDVSYLENCMWRECIHFTNTCQLFYVKRNNQQGSLSSLYHAKNRLCVFFIFVIAKAESSWNITHTYGW